MTFLELCTAIFLFAVFYVYVGYPALLWVWSRVHQQPVLKMRSGLSASLIISAYNEDAVIADKILNALETDYPSGLLEIIIVTDGSDDRTPDIVRGFMDQGIRLLHNPARQGKSAAMNRAAAAAKGEILVFSDANAFYVTGAIGKLAENFADRDVGAVSGRKTVLKDGSKIGQSESAYWSYEGFIRARETETGSTTGVVGEINAIRRRLFQPIPKPIVNDDAYLALSVLRSGHRVVYEPDAISWETSAASMQDEVVRRQRINAGRFQQLFTPSLWRSIDGVTKFKLFSHKYMRLFLPLFMAGALVANCAVLLQSAPHAVFVATLWLQLVFYGLAMVGGLEGSRPRSLPLQRAFHRVARIAHYVVASNIAAVNGLIRFLSGGQSVLWTKARRGGDCPSGKYP